MRAHRTEAKNALLRLVTNQERYYLVNHTYASAFDDTAGISAASENGVYAIALTTDSDWTTGYTATATAVAGGGTNGVDQTADTDCATLSITSAGVKSATGTQAARCW
jgi:type IV pilus assembly protein PilE